MNSTKLQNDFVLSTYPVQVTVGKLKEWIATDDEASKKHIAEFIYHRLNHRYIEPLLHITPPKYRSGFLMMASACLMIETLQSFYTGKKETPRGQGLNSFKDFFQRETKFFPGFAAEFADDKDNFYTNIRCGILHQAETKRGYRILRVGPLLDAKARTVNAEEFLKALARCLDHYVSELRGSESESQLWKSAVQKLDFISDNCKH